VAAATEGKWREERVCEIRACLLLG
jgi:hypothetical protein